MKNKLINLSAALVVALLAVSSMAQMGRSSGSVGSRSRPSYSAPRDTYSSPRQQSGGMGRSGGFNQSPSVSTTPKGSGMGRSGEYGQKPPVTQPKYGSSSSNQRLNTPSNRGGVTSSTRRLYPIGSVPSARYSRTTIVNGRTQYIYPDGSYSWSATGAIAGYLILNDSYNQPVVIQNGGGGNAGTVVLIFVIVIALAIVGAIFMTRK